MYDFFSHFQACKFAEGDSRILLQKIARDRMVAFRKRVKEGGEEEEQLCITIAQAMMGKKGQELNAAWNNQFENVSALAQRVVDRVYSEWNTKKSKL
jgi:NaMN:DMB phosphoribosyltransferase